jgi:uroporphyrin-III C-methyltransferase / precorrin-2 dehydrogenase / sirohydrochlorin ferrochelatase
MELDCSALARPRRTIVVYMGLLGLPTLCRELIAHSLPPTTPAAIVQQGTTSRQRIVSATLSTLPEQPAVEALEPPTLIIVGKVVRLQSTLAWFVPAPTSVAVVAAG